MAITVDNLGLLNPDAVEVNRKLAAALVQEDNPSIEVRRGAIGDMAIYYSAALATKAQAELELDRRSRSLVRILEEPALADDEDVDALAKNYLVDRIAGQQARGHVTIVVSRLSPLTIAAGAVFQGAGLVFATETSFTARTSAANVQSSTDRILTLQADGNYAFDIEVVAEETGTSSQLRKGTSVLPSIPPPYYVSSFASADFTGGVATESNADLAGRLSQGMAAKALSGRTHMTASLREIEEFVNILSDSIIGAGDQEMLRDQHSIFPGSFGGRTDWYIRTQDLPQTLTLTLAASLVEKTANNRGIWQVSLSRDRAPGLYDIVGVTLPGADSAGGYDVVEELRSFDRTAMDSLDVLPDITTATEAAFTRFQTVVLRFLDSDTDTADLAVGDTQDYDILVRALPLLAEIQDQVGSRRVRNTAGDVLVKAPIPCFVALDLTVLIRTGQTAPDLAAIRNDLAAAVNQTGFSGRLDASILADVAHNRLEAGMALSAIDMMGLLYKPNQSTKRLRSSEVLLIPDDPANMTTSRTVAFYLDPDDVAIAVATVDVPEV